MCFLQSSALALALLSLMFSLLWHYSRESHFDWLSLRHLEIAPSMITLYLISLFIPRNISALLDLTKGIERNWKNCSKFSLYA